MADNCWVSRNTMAIKNITSTLAHEINPPIKLQHWTEWVSYQPATWQLWPDCCSNDTCATRASATVDFKSENSFFCPLTAQQVVYGLTILCCKPCLNHNSITSDKTISISSTVTSWLTTLSTVTVLGLPQVSCHTGSYQLQSDRGLPLYSHIYVLVTPTQPAPLAHVTSSTVAPQICGHNLPLRYERKQRWRKKTFLHSYPLVGGCGQPMNVRDSPAALG